METRCQTSSSALKNFPEDLATLLLLISRRLKPLAVTALSALFSGFSCRGQGQWGAVPTCCGHGRLSAVLGGGHFQPSQTLWPCWNYDHASLQECLRRIYHHNL